MGEGQVVTRAAGNTLRGGPGKGEASEVSLRPEESIQGEAVRVALNVFDFGGQIVEASRHRADHRDHSLVGDLHYESPRASTRVHVDDNVFLDLGFLPDLKPAVGSFPFHCQEKKPVEPV